MATNGWIGVDLDGTLAIYEKWSGPDEIGEPIPAMVKRIQQWIKDGKKVKIMTARVASNNKTRDVAKKAIEEWCVKHIGEKLEVTSEKDYMMTELWDDRVVYVVKNTGMTPDELYVAPWDEVTAQNIKPPMFNKK